ncbi:MULTISPECIES: ZIP family metal transporter [Tistrella]|uniref:ZIP family metal transporter n=1 Tax=Tistrella arctica TaxID=3133430 RepID=A0ABU9YI08_9PROT
MAYRRRQPPRRRSEASEADILDLASIDPVWLGLGGSLLAGLATGIGALPVLVIRRPSIRRENLLLGGAAGVMLAAALFSLLVPALDSSTAHYGALGGALGVGAAIALGAAAIAALHAVVPHLHVQQDRDAVDDAAHGAAARGTMITSGGEAVLVMDGGGVAAIDARRMAPALLMVLAIALHNLPEGLAVGVGLGGSGIAGGGDLGDGLALAIGIMIQNLPEGFVAAVGMMMVGASRINAMLVAFGTGALEIIGGGLGVAMAGLGAGVLPWTMAFAAGAMIFVVSHEMIPETHRHGQEMGASWALILGFAGMTAIAASFG